MQKKIGTLVALIAVLGSLFGLVNIASASASSGSCTIASNGVKYCREEVTAPASFSDQKVAKLTVTTDGVLQLEMEMNPAPSVITQGECRWFTGGTNSYKNDLGQIIKISWTGKKSYDCKTNVGPSGWQKEGPGVPCFNYFWPPIVQQPKIIYTGRWEVVNHFTFAVRVSLLLASSANVNAQAQCSVNGASASASVHGSDSLTMTVTGEGSGGSWQEAKSNATKAAMDSKEVNNLESTVKTNAEYRMEASASVTCKAPKPAKPTTTTTVPRPTTTTTAPRPSVCTGLSIGIANSAGRQIRVTGFRFVSGTASYSFTVITWGDGTSVERSNIVGLQHTYNRTGSFRISAMPYFTVSDGARTFGVTSKACAVQVKFAAPRPTTTTTTVKPKPTTTTTTTAPKPTTTTTTKPRPKPKPVIFKLWLLKRVEAAASAKVFVKTSLSGVFKFRVSAKHYATKVVAYRNVNQTLGSFLKGTIVCVKELSAKGYKVVLPRTGEECVRMTRRGSVLFENRIIAVPKKPTTTTTTTTPKSTTSTTTYCCAIPTSTPPPPVVTTTPPPTTATTSPPTTVATTTPPPTTATTTVAKCKCPPPTTTPPPATTTATTSNTTATTLQSSNTTTPPTTEAPPVAPPTTSSPTTNPPPPSW